MIVFDLDFETGDLSQWTTVVTGGGGGSATVQAAAAMGGSGVWGGQIVTDNANSNYMEFRGTPIATDDFRLRYQFDINSMAMADGDDHLPFQIKATTQTNTAKIRVYYTDAAGYQIESGFRDDALTWFLGEKITIPDGPVTVDHHMKKATDGDGASDAWMKTYIDGVLADTISDVDLFDAFDFDGFRFATINADPAYNGSAMFVDNILANDTGDPLPPIGHKGRSGKRGAARQGGARRSGRGGRLL